MLRNRIELLERVLQKNGINVEESVAEILAEKEISDTTDPNCAQSSTVEELCMTFDGALTIDESLNWDQDGEVRYFGPTSGRLLFRSSLNNSPAEDSTQTDASCNGCSTTPSGTCNSISPHCVTQAEETQMNDGQIPNEPRISDELQAHLINLYFDWEQPWLQVVNEKLFRDSLASGGRYCSALLLTCILAIGSRYCHDRLEVRTDPNDPNSAGKGFIGTAERLIPNDLRWPKITTIQSLTIMGMFYIATGSDAAGWLHQGMANRLAIDMGFNMDPAVLTGTVSLPPFEIELRRQIYWALYCHDKLSACYTGRVCTLLESQGAVNKPYLQCVSEVHFPSANGSLRAASQKDTAQLHRSMIDLCRIIEKILQSLWSPKPLVQNSQRSAFFDSCILELKTWYYDLPSELKVDRPSGPSRFPHAYTLSMVYQQAVMLLCCPFISHYYQPEKEGDAAQQLAEKHDGDSPERTRLWKALNSCSSAVRAMCIISQKYRKTFGSFKLSPMTATHSTLSTALIVIELCCSASADSRYKNHPQDDGTKHIPPHAAVALFFQVLRELSTSWNIAKRIGKNLEKVYFDRYGTEHLPADWEGYNREGTCPLSDPAPADEAADMNIEIFDDILNGKTVTPDSPLSFSLHQNPNFNRPGIPGLGFNPLGDIQNFPNSDELFANNLGFAFSPDCLPSDYNMFDTLNQMYLEEKW
ncbi:hypothetical protein N7478_008776 [Penicillium angulare]|uniref:uncharacterized protein n=1 Tax=Penicillium angulare TaxID=116970 RepID=UPI002542507D|nr:uncharacterized protein N7478_008776 [Penicillium angulare]KAJ5273651.1 hypothetical protein N7478_008776 [Penicillium angulare]